MSEWKARRFWKQAEARGVDGGWEIALDGRPVRTPGKHALVLPTRALAAAIADEWDAQSDVIDPNAMPLTRAANSAIEKVAPQFSSVAAMLVDYGTTDLLCYRAEQPEILAAMQIEAWDPLIDWAASCLNAPLLVTNGVIPIAQPDKSIARLRQEVEGLDGFALTALHDLVTLPGSLILGLAVIRGRLTATEAHRLSRVDEDYQTGIWGQDKEAMSAAQNRLVAMIAAESFHSLARQG